MLEALSVMFIISIAVCMINGQCQKVYESGVSANDQVTIINKHNALRLQLAKGNVSGQPTACNMKVLKYDSRLADETQKIANTCKFSHVTVHDSRWTWIGQNLHISSSTSLTGGADWNAAVQHWFNEHKDYHYPENSKSETGHYTQVAWADSEYVGCGYTSYENGDGYQYKKLYVCNYGPGGNIRDIPPYQTTQYGQCGCQNLC
ncbi:hypothetical protein ILUMI_19482 [Ignelater luminosus]|uniref:SCP domain-containing protein n=1 Tax=Ignelater luminosus TaxID=2038154 RepID=A0A8K0CMZ7_IGNLU|nr:hypothetical protein ILUMI_19482 [Ignelater luminosus]